MTDAEVLTHWHDGEREKRGDHRGERRQEVREAIGFKRPSKTFEEGVAGGRSVLLSLPGATPLEGGIPLVVDGEMIGAIGVSGVTSQQDGQIAQAGADALAGIVGKK